MHSAVLILECVAGGDPEEIGLLWKLAEYRASGLIGAHWEDVESSPLP